ncbi:hypothetical protein [Halalkalibacter alkaliphilus]|uniref:DeoR C-terminal sensor domain-containing protein n=1 Tax=Halalkalibacter alkaliphilus TaxID=2917993 RepID=A0A9X2A0V1_9BACI|nr:hypothetical protein [Halalkalibacter alkaliphilus]MCL7746635.1 hypothetical protein [Halalkalibacter alkaliphilus]
MIDISDEIYLLADHTKFVKQAFSRVGTIHTIITDSNTNQEQIEEFQDLGIRIIRS